MSNILTLKKQKNSRKLFSTPVLIPQGDPLPISTFHAFVLPPSLPLSLILPICLFSQANSNNMYYIHVHVHTHTHIHPFLHKKFYQSIFLNNPFQIPRQPPKLPTVQSTFLPFWNMETFACLKSSDFSSLVSKSLNVTDGSSVSSLSSSLRM